VGIVRETAFGRYLSRAAKVNRSGLFPFFNESLLGKRTRVWVNF